MLDKNVPGETLQKMVYFEHKLGDISLGRGDTKQHGNDKRKITREMSFRIPKV